MSGQKIFLLAQRLKDRYNIKIQVLSVVTERRHKLKRLLRKIKNKYKKLRNEIKVLKPSNYARARYFWYREHKKLQEKTILLESLPEERPAANIMAMLKELAENPLYQEYTIWLSGKKTQKQERGRLLEKAGLSNRVRTVETETLLYYRLLATAKYLITEDSFLYIFTKRKGQVLFNLWHGTPLMTLGRNKKMDFGLIGNEQKTFFDADYLLCPNEYTKQCLIEDYMLENFAKTKLLLGDYPRNDVFYRNERRQEIRHAYHLEDKQVIAYLPTWRKNLPEAGVKQRLAQWMEYLLAWDSLLTPSQVVYVKQHPINRLNIDFSAFQHIVPFPKECDTYGFLAASDVLVTDYSSVMFDYLLTGRKIILFVPDNEYFMETRGLHRELSSLPFAKAVSVRQLVEEVNQPKQYDDTECRNTFCSHAKENMAAALCRKVILEQETKQIEEQDIPYNGKKNVLIYMGGFEKNGLTTAGANLLHTLDCTKNNYAVLYCYDSIKKRQESLLVLPEKVARMGFYYYRALTFREQIPYMLWRGFRNIPYSFVAKIMKKLSVRGAERMMGGVRVDTVVQFTGYNDEMIGCMEQMPCNRVIYVHSDMEKEIALRANANQGLLAYAYRSYDTVAAVTEGMIPPAERIADSYRGEKTKEPRFVLCRNVIDYKRIQQLGNQPLEFDKTTAFHLSQEKLLEALASSKKKFVSVGRFSVEKGHERLIQAFERLHKEYPDTCLIIIGGHGNIWNKTVQQVQESSCPEDIFLVRYMSNPFPLVKQCDFFALSSLYEGFGLVLAEADVLGLPCFTTDIDGPRGFMQKYGGLLVENSENGLYHGMCACMEGTIAPRLTIDYEQYNAEAVSQFESVI